MEMTRKHKKQTTKTICATKHEICARNTAPTCKSCNECSKGGNMVSAQMITGYYKHISFPVAVAEKTPAYCEISNARPQKAGRPSAPHQKNGSNVPASRSVTANATITSSTQGTQVCHAIVCRPWDGLWDENK